MLVEVSRKYAFDHLYDVKLFFLFEYVNFSQIFADYVSSLTQNSLKHILVCQEKLQEF